MGCSTLLYLPSQEKGESSGTPPKFSGEQTGLRVDQRRRPEEQTDGRATRGINSKDLIATLNRLFLFSSNTTTMPLSCFCSIQDSLAVSSCITLTGVYPCKQGGKNKRGTISKRARPRGMGSMFLLWYSNRHNQRQPKHHRRRSHPLWWKVWNGKDIRIWKSLKLRKNIWKMEWDEFPRKKGKAPFIGKSDV